jgi:hypothetical protein
MKKQFVLRDAERKKLREDLQRERKERKEVIEFMQNSLTEIQDWLNSVQHLIGPSSHEIQLSSQRGDTSSKSEKELSQDLTAY